MICSNCNTKMRLSNGDYLCPVCLQVKDFDGLVIHPGDGETLWDASSSCEHEIDQHCFDGIRCKKCNGYICY